jgi:hypothetical protein
MESDMRRLEPGQGLGMAASGVPGKDYPSSMTR